MQCGTLDWVLEQKKDTGEIAAKLGVSLLVMCQPALVSQVQQVLWVPDANTWETGERRTGALSVSVLQVFCVCKIVSKQKLYLKKKRKESKCMF